MPSTATRTSSSQTYVAVEPDGLDPCDLRLKAGRRGRARAGRPPGAALPLRARQRRRQVRPRPRRRAGRRAARGGAAGLQHPRQVEGRRVRPRARRHGRRRRRRGPRRGAAGRRPPVAPGDAWRAPCGPPRRGPRRGSPAPRPPLPDLRDPRFSIERETAQARLQHPAVVGRTAADVGANDFTHPTYRARVGGGVRGRRPDRRRCRRPGWADSAARRRERPRRLLGDQRARRRAAADSEGPRRRLRRRARLPAPGAHRACGASPSVKSRLQRTNPVEHATDYNRMFGELVALEQHRREPCASASMGDAVRRRFGRRTPPVARSAPGERVLAWAQAAGGHVVAGTRDAFYLRGRCRRAVRLPWEQVEAADWDRDTVGAPGHRGRHLGRAAAGARRRRSTSPATCSALVRERVTASDRAAAPRPGRRPARSARDRAPRPGRRCARWQWVYEYDEGVDPDDPAVRAAAAAALAQARADTGL